jgi:hypothetical protein
VLTGAWMLRAAGDATKALTFVLPL